MFPSFLIFFVDAPQKRYTGFLTTICGVGHIYNRVSRKMIRTAYEEFKCDIRELTLSEMKEKIQHATELSTINNNCETLAPYVLHFLLSCHSHMTYFSISLYLYLSWKPCHKLLLPILRRNFSEYNFNALVRLGFDGTIILSFWINKIWSSNPSYNKIRLFDRNRTTQYYIFSS